MLEMDTSILTPERVFKASGHIDKFTDWMCKDPVTGDFLRADHLVAGVLRARISDGQLGYNARCEAETMLACVDSFDGEKLKDLIGRFDIRNPNGNGRLEEPRAFNLMFKSSIDPSSESPVYLRPETAQGQFLNFKRLLDYNQGNMPFASACIGKAFRNEISPRSGLLRVREFLLAEVEHYVDPNGGKCHERFHEVANLELPLLDQHNQLAGHNNVNMWYIDEAVEQNIIDNEIIAYFLARTYLFLIKLGADRTKIRFRQHMFNERAHYASDCWDAELLTSYGWIECAGCADRGTFDMTAHEASSGTPLYAMETRKIPFVNEHWVATLDRRMAGNVFRKDLGQVLSAVRALRQETLETFAKDLSEKKKITVPTARLANGDRTAELDSSILSIEKVTATEMVKRYKPNVIEPSFGIGRILYCVLEHVHWHRSQDVARQVLSIPATIAPTKVLLAPLSNNDEFEAATKDLARRFRSLGIANGTDMSSASIGKRYARNDELGTPFTVTIDFQSVQDGTVTLRERDSTAQVRDSDDIIVEAVQKLVNGVETWEQVLERLPKVDTIMRSV